MWLKVRFKTTEEPDGVRIACEVVDPALTDVNPCRLTRSFPDRNHLRDVLASAGIPGAIADDEEGRHVHEVRSFQMMSLGFLDFPVPYIRASCFIIEVPQRRELMHWTVAEDGSGRAWSICIGTSHPSIKEPPISGLGTLGDGDGRLYKVTERHALVDEDVLQRECTLGTPPPGTIE